VTSNEATTPVDEFVLDTPRLRRFIKSVQHIRGTTSGAEATIEAIRPYFVELLADHSWLPERYQEPAVEGGMGSGIGTWLLFRAGDGSLAFSSLVVPAGAQTPVHDHLAWGLVGLYRGEQAEDVFNRCDAGAIDGQATLVLSERRLLRPGELYDLLPATDIHRVQTVSSVTSVSLHLLANDNGCIWRHRFFPEEQRVVPFRSGYVNVECRE